MTQYIWDQNLFNKVLLSALAGHAAYLPDRANAAWTAANRAKLRARNHWLQVDPPLAPPGWLGSSGKYFPRAPRLYGRKPWVPMRYGALRAAYFFLVSGFFFLQAPMRYGALWAALPTAPPVAAAGEASCRSGGAPAYCGGGSERVLLAPAWLVAMEQGLGHSLKAEDYGARPLPA